MTGILRAATAHGTAGDNNNNNNNNGNRILWHVKERMASSKSSHASTEWTIVTKDDKKRVMRRTRRGGHRRRDGRTTTTSHNRYTSNGGGTYITDYEILSKVLADCQDELRQTDFYRHLEDTLRLRNIQHIVCYGIGNVSETSATHYAAPLWQLACALLLRDGVVTNETLRPAADAWGLSSTQTRLYFCDPCSTTSERDFLKSLNVTVWTDNDRGLRVLPPNTLIFMPHCPRRLYEHVMYANGWKNDNHSQRRDIIVFGNSLVSHPHVIRTNDLQRKFPCLNALQPRMRQELVEVASRRDQDSASGNLVGAFNDCYVTTFDNSNASTWPRRPELVVQDDEDEELV